MNYQSTMQMDMAMMSGKMMCMCRMLKCAKTE